MPYITKSKREEFSDLEASFFGCISDVTEPGDIVYIIFMLLTIYMRTKGESFKTHNEIMGILSSSSQEYYRRFVSPYEDKKIKENGDII